MARPGGIELGGRRMLVPRRFARAVKRDEVSLHYQPIVSMATGDIVAAEALVRWARPQGDWVPPGLFLPLLRGTRQANVLQRFVLQTAVRQARSWQAAGRSLQVTINVAPESVSLDFVADVAAALGDSGLPGSLLHVELTELEDGDEGLGERTAALQQLRMLGVSLSLDDFGQGDSSLRRLVSFPLDLLKIDKSFVAEMQHDRRSAGVVRSATELAHTLEMSAVGEGVETEEQWHRLRAWGCDYAQGFLISRPLPAEAFMTSLASDVVPILDRLVEARAPVERRVGPSDRRRGPLDRRGRRWPPPRRHGIARH